MELLAYNYDALVKSRVKFEWDPRGNQIFNKTFTLKNSISLIPFNNSHESPNIIQVWLQMMQAQICPCYLVY